MELDQLKKIWQQEPSATKEDQQLLQLLRKRSNNPIARMKRNLLFELIAIVALYGATIVYYAYAFHGTMSEVSWFMVVIALSFLLYYYMKNRLLNKMECVACQVKSNLQRQVNTLEKYVKFYLIAGTALAPIVIENAPGARPILSGLNTNFTASWTVHDSITNDLARFYRLRHVGP